MNEERLKYSINDKIYVVERKYQGLFHIHTGRITQIIIKEMGVSYLLENDEYTEFFDSVDIFDSFEDAKNYCLKYVKTKYEVDVKLINEMRERG